MDNEQTVTDERLEDLIRLGEKFGADDTLKCLRELQAARPALATLRAEVERLTKLLAAWETNSNEWQRTAHDLSPELARLEGLYEEKMADIARLRDERDAARATLEAVRAAAYQGNCHHCSARIEDDEEVSCVDLEDACPETGCGSKWLCANDILALLDAPAPASSDFVRSFAASAAPALALKLEAVRAKCAVSHELRLSDYEQGRQDIANEVLDILDAPAPAPAEPAAPAPVGWDRAALAAVVHEAATGPVAALEGRIVDGIMAQWPGGVPVGEWETVEVETVPGFLPVKTEIRNPWVSSEAGTYYLVPVTAPEPGVDGDE